MDAPCGIENNPDCPHCGQEIEKAIDYLRGGAKTATGFACEDCNLEWTWEEWEEGKTFTPDPDPDPQHQMADLEQRQLGHCFNDLCTAVERDRFQVETPRVHVGCSTFDRVDVSVSRDTEEHHSWNRQVGVSVGPPYLEVRMEWSPDDHTLLEDLRKHGALEGLCILYGDMHLWRMAEQYGNKIQAWVNQDGTDPAARADFEWRAVEPVGWR
jgi:hypothetical protein